jgi:hypothetical protein
VFDVGRLGSEKDEANDDRDVSVLAGSLVRLVPRVPLSWSLPWPFPLSLPLPYLPT